MELAIYAGSVYSVPHDVDVATLTAGLTKEALNSLIGSNEMKLSREYKWY